MVAISVEHLGDTLWEHLDGHDADINSAELDVRQLDIRAALDQVAAGGTPISGVADLAHVGMLGHSMGAVTAGRVAQLDPRITAAAALCSPMENPLVTGVTLADIHVPLFFMVAIEDNSITEFGNKFIRDNFKATTNEAYKVEVPDAGHWSVSDLDGLVDIFAPGCGDGAAPDRRHRLHVPRPADRAKHRRVVRDRVLRGDAARRRRRPIIRRAVEPDVRRARSRSPLTSSAPSGTQTTNHSE